MNRKALLTIAGAIICGAIAILMVNHYIKKKEKDLYRGMELVSIIAVTKDVDAGTMISTSILAKRSMPKKYVHGNAVAPKDINLVLGQVLNFPLKRGDPLLWTDLGKEGEAVRVRGLAGTITRGERALSISVDIVSGISGLLKPNDHIDILCTARNQKTGEEATLTILQNITILATGSDLSRAGASSGRYGTLTLLVTLEEAELLTFAQEKGKLVAILRNPEDIETHKDIPKVTFSDIMRTEFRKKIQETRDKIEVIKMGQDVK